MLAVTSATGKLGSSVIAAILKYNLLDAKELVVCTSSDPHCPKLAHIRSYNPIIRHATFDSPATMVAAFRDCNALFLVSTPHISMDFNNAPPGTGREAHHRAAIKAAISVGVKHIYYTSLAFANPSKAGVMRAHIRTEAYLQELAEAGKVAFTIIREGLYSESWPLYFGYYYGLRQEQRRDVVVAGDGEVSWTAIEDMAEGTAKILAGPSEDWKGKIVYLCQKKSASLADIAKIVSRTLGEEVRLNVFSRKDYEDYYVKRGMERPSVEWWSGTYDALCDGECKVEDSTLERLLGRQMKPLEQTIEEMLQ